MVSSSDALAWADSMIELRPSTVWDWSVSSIDANRISKQVSRFSLHTCSRYERQFSSRWRMMRLPQHVRRPRHHRGAPRRRDLRVVASKWASRGNGRPAWRSLELDLLI